jgi:hypothetical protein
MIGQQWRRHWFRHQGNPRKPIPFRCSIRLTDLFSVRGRFLVPVLSISAPIFLETLGTCLLVCSVGARRKSVAVWAHGASPVAASGTVEMGGLFGAVLSTAVGALIVSFEGSLCVSPVIPTGLCAFDPRIVCIAVIYLRGLMRQSAPITPLMGCVRASFFHSEATLSQASRSPG